MSDFYELFIKLKNKEIRISLESDKLNFEENMFGKVIKVDDLSNCIILWNDGAKSLNIQKEYINTIDEIPSNNRFFKGLEVLFIDGETIKLEI